MSENRYTLYIAGPMSGKAHHNFPAFDEAAQTLRQLGYRVINPAELTRELPGEPGSLPYEVYLRNDLKNMVTEATDLVLLPDWEDSRGARIEFEVAVILNFRIWLYFNHALKRLPHGDASV